MHLKCDFLFQIVAMHSNDKRNTNILFSRKWISRAMRFSPLLATIENNSIFQELWIEFMFLLIVQIEIVQAALNHLRDGYNENEIENQITSLESFSNIIERMRCACYAVCKLYNSACMGRPLFTQQMNNIYKWPFEHVKQTSVINATEKSKSRAQKAPNSSNTVSNAKRLRQDNEGKKCAAHNEFIINW